HGFTLFLLSFMLFVMQSTGYYWNFSSFLVFNAIIVIGVLMILGVANMVISEVLWSINTLGKGESWLLQGFLILIPTQFLLVPYSNILYQLSQMSTYYNFVYAGILFLVYLLIFGGIGRSVASRYQEKDSRKSEHRKTSRPIEIGTTRSACTKCGSSHEYYDKNISQNGTVKCYTCGKEFPISSTTDLLSKLDL
ncbi:MAG: hypothetical protein ACFFEV_04545, partial [Candidatus Thorarchaeota archaeon]